MPWELTLEDPPSFPLLAPLDRQRRDVLRRAVGSEVTARALALLAIAGSPTDGRRLIRLHASGVFEDLKHDWLAAPPLQLF
jgi:hypothetical protein